MSDTGWRHLSHVTFYPIRFDNSNAVRYHSSMIRSFYSAEEKKIFNREYSRHLPHAIQSVALRKLWMIDAAVDLNDLRVPPANHLEKLRRRRKDQYSIRINKQWRICFVGEGNDAYKVEIVDYH